MSSLEGKLLICDMCEEKVFLKYINERVGDGGYSRTKIYQDAPEGWARVNLGEGLIDVCPECKKKFDKWIEEYFGGERK